MRKLTFLLSVIVLCTYLSGCTDTGRNENESPDFPSTVGELAYDAEYSCEHIIYILENEEYVPYIVVSNNYQGMALLLRKNVLDESMIFNPLNCESLSSYYPDSSICTWLEDTFRYTISAPIETVNLEVTNEEAIKHHPGGTEQVQASVFLLSATEVCFPDRYAFCREGGELELFENLDESRVALNGDNKATGWWLRTPSISISASVYTVADEGYVGSEGLYTIAGVTSLGVRPAFCVKANTETVYTDGMFYLTE